MRIERMEAVIMPQEKRVEDIPAGTVFDGVAKSTLYSDWQGPWLKTDEGGIVNLDMDSGFEYTESHVSSAGGMVIVDYQPLRAHVVIEGPGEEAEY
jgi:hypothetical protein